jgi:hypothetical protein
LANQSRGMRSRWSRSMVIPCRDTDRKAGIMRAQGEEVSTDTSLSTCKCTWHNYTEDLHLHCQQNFRPSSLSLFHRYRLLPRTNKTLSTTGYWYIQVDISAEARTVESTLVVSLSIAGLSSKFVVTQVVKNFPASTEPKVSLLCFHDFWFVLGFEFRTAYQLSYLTEI